MKKLLTSVSTIVLSLALIFTSITPAYATIPNGTVVFSNGQALDLTYANNATNQSEVTQDVVNSNGGIYVVDFGGSFINNSTSTTLTSTQVSSLIPAVTYKGAQGNTKHFESGNGVEITATDVITATSIPVTFGSAVTIKITNPVTFATATQYQMFVDGSASSSKVNIGTATTIFPAKTTGDTIQVEFFDATGLQVGTTQNVTIGSTTPVTTVTVSSISPISISTTTGIAPTLPSTVTVNMSDGTTKKVNVTWIDPNRTLNAGIYTFYGTVNGYSGQVKLTLTVNAPAKILQYLTIVPPSKTTYNMNDPLDTTGMKVTATYSDGTYQDVTSQCTNNFNSSVAGLKTVTVSFQNKTCLFFVTIKNSAQIELIRQQYLTQLSNLQTILTNVKNQKNVSVLTKNPDGSWGYTYIADPDAVASAQKNYDTEYSAYQIWLASVGLN